MRARRYAASRQKACQPCAISKTKCDRKAGSCGRCTLRGLSCTYPQAISPPSSGEAEMCTTLSPHSALLPLDKMLPDPEHVLSAGVQGGSQITTSTQSSTAECVAPASPRIIAEALSVSDPKLNGTSGAYEEPTDPLDFHSLELVCPINVDDISNRWLNPYLPIPGQTAKQYSPGVAAFLGRVLKSYTANAVKGRGIPPFIHSSQMLATSSGSPVTTCLSLVRVCDGPLPRSERVAADVLQREMDDLYERHGTYDDMSTLAAFQAFLLYSMVRFFQLGKGPDPFLRQAMINLQEIACTSSRQGLMCLAEQQRARPKWESWIAAEAKRRTLLTMYLFDNLLSIQDGLPIFLGTELQGLPAPAGKILWQAQNRHQWETAYNVHLAEWSEGGLHINELWPIPADWNEADVMARRRRVDQWLEDVDEFGTMLYAVTSCTHGG